MKVTKNVHAEMMAARREKRARRAAAQAKGNEQALDQFVARVNEVRLLLGTLSEVTDEHFGLTPEEIHWGHVGDVTRTRDQLKDMLDQIRSEGEYAK